MLIIKANDKYGNFYVSSDVPTIGLGLMRSYCSDNEIVGKRVRKAMGGYEKTGLKTVFFAYCENPALGTGSSITGISGIGWPLDGFLVAKYNIAMKKVDIFSCFGEKVCKKVKMVENVPTLREALWHLECESTDYCGFKLSLKMRIRRELIKKLNGEPALKEIKYGNRIYVISTGEWRDIKAENKEEEPKKEEEKKEEIKKNEKDPFGEN